MRTKTPIFVSALLLLGIPTLLLAKGETVRITIKGDDLAAPIEVTDPLVVQKFGVWTGPGTSSNQSQGLIVDWSRGFAKRPSAKFRVYTVSFYVNDRRERLAYVVLYACEPSTNDGFVYVPGQGDPSYSLNVASVVRGVEGQWFHAWSAWDSLAQPLLEAAGRKRAPGP